MNNLIFRWIIILFIFISLGLSQTLALIEVEFDTTNYSVSVPVSVNLDEITFLNEKQIVLYQLVAGNKIPVATQVKNAESRMLYWLITLDGSNTYNFELSRTKVHSETPKVKIKLANGRLTIFAEERDLLGYQFETMYPPPEVDSVYKRSGFIHPLWSPHGQVLTRIFPPDHYHHFGIWNPWTRVLFEADTVDFWNLRGKQGTVRFDKFIGITEGAVFAEFQAVHEHVVFKKDGSQKVAINELQTVRVYHPDRDYFIVDLTVHLNCVWENPVKLLAYTYGGFGWRATEKWHPLNSEMLTSEGKIRTEADNSRAQWYYLQGEMENDYAGILMLSYPTNFDHPQPLRIWSDSDESRGLFTSFSPTRNNDWLLEPGKENYLKYRFIVYNGNADRKFAENMWQFYINPPKIKIKR